MITHLLTDMLTNLLYAVLPVLAWTGGLALALFVGVVLMFRPMVRLDKQAVAAFASARVAARQAATAATKLPSTPGESVCVRLGGRLIRMEVV